MPVVVLAGALGVDWVLTHLVEVAAVAGGSGALAVAASVVLLRLADRRDERQAVAWRLSRACDAPRTGNGITGFTAEVLDGAKPPSRPALAPVTIINNFYGAGGEQAAARVIRTAITGRPGDAASEGEPQCSEN